MHPEAQHTGYYNDLDMMVVGMRGMTEPWERIHMGLWTLSSAPMMVGADLTRLKPSSIALLTNREALAVHHDALGLQAVKVAEPKPGLQVWAKLLADPGKRAIALLNRTDEPAPITAEWSKLGLASAAATVRDIFAGRDMGQYDSAFTATVPAQDMVLLVVSGQDKPAVFYGAAGAASELIGGAAAEACPECPGGRSVAIGGNRALSVKSIASAIGPAFVRVVYRNESKTTVVARLNVNGASSTGVAFPPTGKELRFIALRLNLRSQDRPNVLEFTAPSGEEVALGAIGVSSW
jgi:hypothetical protein